MEKLFAIDKVLLIIYEKLTFAEQLKFAQVNSLLRNIFANCVVPMKYRKLKIIKINDVNDKLLVSNDEDDDCMLLTHDELEGVFKFGLDKVEKLQVISIYDENTNAKDTTLLTSSLLSWGNLQNLTCLHYQRTILSDKHLLLIASKCPNLSELRLIYCKSEVIKKNYDHKKESCICYGYQKNEDLVLDGKGEGGISVSILEKIKNLKILVLYTAKEIDTKLFSDLITKVPVECLKLENCLVEDKMHSNFVLSLFNCNSKTPIQHNLKELEIKVNCESLKFLESKGILKNLLKLHLNINRDVATNSALQTIARACGNLECLILSANFEGITKFLLPPNLKELYLLECWGLEQKHFKDALTKYKIEKFIYQGDDELNSFEDFTISPHIKILGLENVSMLEFPSSYSNNMALKELHWYDYGRNPNQNETRIRQSLKTCRNLESLHIHKDYISADVILQMQHLHELQIHPVVEQLSWAFYIALLKHPTLKKVEVDNYHAQLADVINIPPQGFASNITLFTMSFDLLEKGLDFWLNMLQQNPKMTIKCYLAVWREMDYTLSFLEKLICHENFPKYLKEIKIVGFNLNCKDLRENFQATIEPVKFLEELYNTTIVLSPKET